MTIAEQLKAEGVQQEKTIIAERLLSEGMDITFIAKITNLSLEKVKELQKKSH